MNRHPTAPWSLRIRRTEDRGGDAVGAGFLVLPDIALTCAHVVDDGSGATEMLVDFPSGTAAGTRATPRVVVPGGQEDHNRDLIVLRLERAFPSVPVAVLADGEPPLTGTELSAFGFPGGFEAPRGTPQPEVNSPGVWTQVTVQGTDFQGRLLQSRLKGVHGIPVVEGFSGGPVVDDRTGTVVAMTVMALKGVSYSLLARTIVDLLPPDITARITARPSPPPALRRVVVALNRRAADGRRSPDFVTARSGMAELLSLASGHPDVAYYAALTALGGCRPREPALAYAVTRIDERFRSAYHAGTAPPHLLALWAVVKEDGTIGRGMGDHAPFAAELRAAVARTARAHADEICDLVPAPEAPTWYELNLRRRR
ncbi:S1 family peptidase [Streptomyces sp. FR-108]|uniref:S1 family peptidase n=1 Tax=Streptomyces sp. FR-108 TaxID=3416665 RepID=UPI003CF68B24